jgi:hypothetical protein
LQASAIHTPVGLLLAPDTLKSTKSPAATVTFPDTVHEAPGLTEHTSDVFAMLPGVPSRSVTVSVFAASRENTLNCVAEQPAGTHVNTGSVSVAAEFALFTE